ncbi:MAG: hypothetical protein ACQEQL_07490 [Pseudomonadota bacterium]
MNYRLIMQYQARVAKRFLEQNQTRKLEEGYVSENEHTVSLVESPRDDTAQHIKIFNFAQKEVTIVNAEKNMDIVQFNRFPDQRQLEKAAQKLKDFGGDPGNWRMLKPGNLATKPRLK